MSDTQCLIRKLIIARRAIETARKVLAVLQMQRNGRTCCRIDAGRSAMSGPAADQWHSVGDGQSSRMGRINLDRLVANLRCRQT